MFTFIAIATVLSCIAGDTLTMCRITYSRQDLLSCNSQPRDYLTQDLYGLLRQNRITRAPPTRRGHRAGCTQQRPIRTIVTPMSERTASSPNSLGRINVRNLIPIKLQHVPSDKLLDVCVLNTRSLKKAQEVKNFIVDSKADLCALTEIWLKGNESDKQKINDTCPTGYELPHEPRLTGRGGGVGLVHKSVLRIKARLISVQVAL